MSFHVVHIRQIESKMLQDSDLAMAPDGSKRRCDGCLNHTKLVIYHNSKPFIHDFFDLHDYFFLFIPVFDLLSGFSPFQGIMPEKEGWQVLRFFVYLQSQELITKDV